MTSQAKRNALITIFRKEINNSAQVNTSYFKNLEIELDDDHQDQVNNAITHFMEKAKQAKKGA